MKKGIWHAPITGAVQTARWLMLLGLFLSVTAASAVEPTNTMAVVNHSFAEVQSAIGKYYTNAMDQAKTVDNKTFSLKAFDWMYVSPAITNSLGETGLRFNLICCHSIPATYTVTVTTVTSNTTRLQVDPQPMGENDKQFNITPQALAKHSSKILNGVLRTLDPKP